MEKAHRWSKFFHDYLFLAILYVFFLLPTLMMWLNTNLLHWKPEETAKLANSILLSSAVLLLFNAWFVWKFRLKPKYDKKYGLSISKLKATINNIEENSDLYKLGLRNGDIIVALDKKPLTGTMGLPNWWEYRESMPLTVLRDDQEVQVTLKKNSP